LALNVASNFLRAFVISMLHRLRQSRTLYTLTAGPKFGVHFKLAKFPSMSCPLSEIKHGRVMVFRHLRHWAHIPEPPRFRYNPAAAPSSAVVAIHMLKSKAGGSFLRRQANYRVVLKPVDQNVLPWTGRRSAPCALLPRENACVAAAIWGRADSLGQNACDAG